MKNTKCFAAAVALAATLIGSSAFAQSSDRVNTTPTPNQVVYLPQLPGPGELAKAAPAQGVTIAQITQSSDQVTVVYKLANGQTNTVAYRLLSAADSPAMPPYQASSAAVPSQPAPVGAPPTSTVIYTQAAPVYYAPDPYYWPWYGPPVAVGIDWGWGWHGGGWGGRFRGR